MYIQTLTVYEVKPMQSKGKTFFQCQFRDIRGKKDGTGIYAAFIIKGTFWEDCPVAEGDLVLIQADLVNNFYKDSEGKSKSSPELRNIVILKNFGANTMPLTSNDCEVPF